MIEGDKVVICIPTRENPGTIHNKGNKGNIKVTMET